MRPTFPGPSRDPHLPSRTSGLRVAGAVHVCCARPGVRGPHQGRGSLVWKITGPVLGFPGFGAPQGSGIMARQPHWLRFLIPARPGSGRMLRVPTYPGLGSLPGGRLLLTTGQDEGLCHRPPRKWQAGSLPLRGAWSGELCPHPHPQAGPIQRRSNAERDPCALALHCGPPRSECAVHSRCPAKPQAGLGLFQEEDSAGAEGPWPQFTHSCVAGAACVCLGQGLAGLAGGNRGLGLGQVRTPHHDPRSTPSVSGLSSAQRV